MSMNVENWLPRAGRTLDSAPNAPRELYERLKYVADLLKDCGKLPLDAVLLYRVGELDAEFRTIDKLLVVGRSEPADLVVEEKKLSRRHFVVSLESGEAVIRDLNSKNGTYVDGKRIDEGLLKDGDIIEAGGLVFVFLEGSSSEEIEGLA